MKITSNAEVVLGDVLSQLYKVEATIPFNLERAAEAGRDLVKKRVESGLNSQNEVMVTSSTKTLGRYSYGHGTKRSKRGLQTAKVDLSFTGEMISSFNLLDIARYSVSVGFQNERAAEIAEYNAERFGAAFPLGDQEESEVTEIYYYFFRGFIN